MYLEQSENNSEEPFNRPLYPNEQMLCDALDQLEKFTLNFQPEKVTTLHELSSIISGIDDQLEIIFDYYADFNTTYRDDRRDMSEAVLVKEIENFENTGKTIELLMRRYFTFGSTNNRDFFEICFKTLINEQKFTVFNVFMPYAESKNYLAAAYYVNKQFHKPYENGDFLSIQNYLTFLLRACKQLVLLFQTNDKVPETIKKEFVDPDLDMVGQ